MAILLGVLIVAEFASNDVRPGDAFASGTETLGQTASVFGILVVRLLVILGFVIIGVLRLNDLGHRSLWLLLYFVPLVGFGLLIYLGLAPTKNR